MKIAIVGTGISGMVAAHLLHREHEIDVYEAGPWIGGHTNTVDVPSAAGSLAVDTGFIVFNERTYPLFIRLLEEHGVAWKESDMSFSVRCEKTGLEYNGASLNTLFAQRTNLVRPSFWRMVLDLLRFYREAPKVLRAADDGLTLGEFLQRNRYSEIFAEKHLVPMGAAIWSACPETMRDFPLRFLVQFFQNHGFLQVDDRPQWLVIEGGSREYVKKLTAPWADRIRLETPVASVERRGEGVRLRTAHGDEEQYDRVVLACHADQSLRLLRDANPLEREILGAFPFQRNEAVLHTDASLMPRKRLAWASWNYHVTDPPSALPTVTYWMNRLQSLPGRTQYFLTLNRSAAIDVTKVRRRFIYHHPIFTTETVRAQARHAEIDGVHGVHFCGAYWGYGFHEDGVRSAFSSVSELAREPLREPVAG